MVLFHLPCWLDFLLRIIESTTPISNFNNVWLDFKHTLEKYSVDATYIVNGNVICSEYTIIYDYFISSLLYNWCSNKQKSMKFCKLRFVLLYFCFYNKSCQVVKHCVEAKTDIWHSSKVINKKSNILGMLSPLMLELLSDIWNPIQSSSIKMFALLLHFCLFRNLLLMV